MFKIEILKSGLLSPKDPKDQTANEAIQTIYKLTGNKVCFKWGKKEFIADLESDISVSWRDIISLINDLEKNRAEAVLQFPSQTFWHYWRFEEVDGDTWEVNLQYGHSDNHQLLANKGRVLVAFKKLKASVEADLIRQGYNL